MKEKGRE